MRTLRLARDGHCGMPWPQTWLRSKSCRPLPPRADLAAGLFAGSFARRAALQAQFPAAIEHGDEPDHAGIALAPFPGKTLKAAALAFEFVEIAADIFDGRDAGFEQGPVRRIPFREILDRLAAGRLLVFGEQIFDLRAVAMRAERRRQRMIDGRGIDADQLHPLFDQPLRRRLAQARRMAEIFLAVGIFAVPAGIDQTRCRRSGSSAWRVRDRTARSSPICVSGSRPRRRCRKTARVQSRRRRRRPGPDAAAR